MIRIRAFSRSTSVLATAILCLVLVPLSYVLHAADGDLDTTFGKDGRVRTDFSGGSIEVALAVATQPDGKIVAAGVTSGLSSEFGLARYNRDGSLDRTFGDGGKVRSTFRGWEIAFAVAIQPDGKIVAAGTSMTFDGVTPSAFIVARYNRDGSLDRRFGDEGKVITEFPDVYADARALAIQPDGKIVVVGQAVGPQGFTADVAIARYLPNGSLDPAFGAGGRVTASVDDLDDPRAVAVSFDGRITVAESTRALMSFNDDLAVLRFRRDGSLDQTFGLGGVVRTDVSGEQDFASSVMLERNGKIVVAGYTIGGTPFFHTDVVLARYNPDGVLDPAFGKGGLAVSPSGGQVQAAALQTDGKIVAGIIGAGFTVARYDTDGSVDSTFGLGGIAQADFSTPEEHTMDVLTSLVIERDGRIVAAGYTSHFLTTGDIDFALLRIDASSTPPRPR